MKKKDKKRLYLTIYDIPIARCFLILGSGLIIGWYSIISGFTFLKDYIKFRKKKKSNS